MSNLSEALESGRFVVTGEIGPPKGTSVEKCLEDAEHLRGKVAAINVTDIQSAVMRFGVLATCHMLIDRDLEPIFQMVCRDRNRLALQSDLLSAYVLGVRNVLALTGDHNILGDHPDSKPVFDLEAVGLLQCIGTLCEGRDMAGNELEGSPEFFPGAVVAPASDPVEMQIMRMEKKIAAGARFFQTQAVYDVDQFAQFMAQIQGLGVPVLCGIVLLKSAGMARFMNKNV
ncbi:MAG: methylenetetrahydrofolate reductase, partial [Planctomycetota bacterium]